MRLSEPKFKSRGYEGQSQPQLPTHFSILLWLRSVVKILLCV